MRAPSSGDHGAYLAARYFPSLDALRALSIVPVVWHHCTPRPLEGVLGRGPLGVDLFFAISGFLITTLLVRERDRHGTISLKLFYARRTLRIFPLFYAVLALYVVYTALSPASAVRSHFFRSLPFYATYTSNWLVDFAVPHPVVFAFAWSLATEEQFYLVWPTLLRMFRRALFPALFMGGLLVADQLAEHGVILAGGGLARTMATSIATPICLGALLALCLHDARGFRVLAPLLRWRASAPLCLTLLIALVAWDGAPLWAIHVAMAALVGAVCVRADHGLGAVADRRPLRHVGAVSYGMYLWHVAVVGGVKFLLPHPERHAWLVFVLALPLTVLVATLSYELFEKRILRLKDRLRPAGS